MFENSYEVEWTLRITGRNTVHADTVEQVQSYMEMLTPVELMEADLRGGGDFEFEIEWIDLL
jgi:hypothetical protein